MYCIILLVIVFIMVIVIVCSLFIKSITPLKDNDIRKCETQIYNIHKKRYPTSQTVTSNFILFDTKTDYSFFIGFEYEISQDEMIEKLKSFQNKKVTIVYTENKRTIPTLDLSFYDKYEVMYIECEGTVMGDIESYKKVDTSGIIAFIFPALGILFFFSVFFIAAFISIKSKWDYIKNITSIKIIEATDDDSYVTLKHIESEKYSELYKKLSKTKDYFEDNESHEEIDSQMEKYSQYGKVFKPKKRGFLIEYINDEYDVIYAYEVKKYRKKNDELKEYSENVDRLDSKFNALIKEYYSE